MLIAKDILKKHEYNCPLWLFKDQTINSQLKSWNQMQKALYSWQNAEIQNILSSKICDHN